MGIEGLSPAQILMVVVVTAIGSALQGSIGFGLGLVAAPVLALADPAFVPGPILAVAIPLGFGVVVRERHLVDVSQLRWALAGRVVGTVAAAVVLVVVKTDRMAALFAILVLVAVVLSVVGWTVEPTSRSLTLAGAASGFMGTATSIGGPPIALLYQRQQGFRLRTTVAVVLAVGAVISLVSLIVVGRYRVHELVLTALLLPGVAVGFGFSHRARAVMDRGWARPAVLAVAAASALALLVREII